jgi:hypothetical protein
LFNHKVEYIGGTTFVNRVVERRSYRAPGAPAALGTPATRGGWAQQLNCNNRDQNGSRRILPWLRSGSSWLTEAGSAVIL